MANGNGLSLEVVHHELERLGSLVRSLSTQVASVRVRVSDLEHWDPISNRGELRLLGKDTKKKGNRRGKRKGKGKGKGKGKQPGKGKGKGKGTGKRAWSGR